MCITIAMSALTLCSTIVLPRSGSTYLHSMPPPNTRNDKTEPRNTPSFAMLSISPQPIVRNVPCLETSPFFYGASQAFTLPKASLSYPFNARNGVLYPTSTSPATFLRHVYGQHTHSLGHGQAFRPLSADALIGLPMGYVLKAQPTIHGTRHNFEAALGLAF